MKPRHRSIVLSVAYHGVKETAAAFHVTERQVRRVVRDAMDRYGCRTEYELFRRTERRERRQPEWVGSLW